MMESPMHSTMDNGKRVLDQDKVEIHSKSVDVVERVDTTKESASRRKQTKQTDTTELMLLKKRMPMWHVTLIPVKNTS